MQKLLVFGALLAVAAALIHPDPAKAAETDSAVYVELQASDNAAAVERWKLYGASHALVIGIDEYTAGWPRLSNAVKDAEEVAAALTSQGFEVATLLNPTGERLRSELRNFFALKGADPEARLFVWFAGHGFTEFGEGYLVPADAPDPSEPAFRAIALHMGDVGSMVRIARSKHVFAVFDSCFAGTIFNASRARPPAAITRAVAEPVRQFLTSGDAEQEVSDDGSFRKLFLKALAGEENADANGDGYLTGTELSLFLEDRVVNLTNSQQTPRSGKLRDQRFDLGDFVFLLPKEEEPVQVAAAAPQAPPAAGPTAGVDSELTVELAFWDAIKTSESADDYQAYLTAFPKGRFAVLAETRIAKLNAEGTSAQTRGAAPAEQPTQVAALPPPQAPQPQADPAEQAELALGLNRADRQELQAALTALGYDTKGIDGFFGPGTRDAIRSYQAKKGVEQSGYLTAALAGSLIAEAPKPEPATPPAAPAPTAAPAPNPAQTQVAAVPQASAVLPPPASVSKQEVERYFAANKPEMTAMFLEYNRRGRVLLNWQAETAEKLEITGFRVVDIANDTVLAEVSLVSIEKNKMARSNVTKDFLLRWTGGGLEILRHLGDRETRSTAIATAVSAPAVQAPQQQAPQPAKQPQPAETQTAALPPAGVSKEQVEAYVAANENRVNAQFLAYNERARFFLHHSGATSPAMTVSSFNVLSISGEQILARIGFSMGSFYRQSATHEFNLKWTGDGFEILGHQ